nr:MAG TPA: hypothetical protein [Caudoviricetes sp.]
MMTRKNIETSNKIDVNGDVLGKELYYCFVRKDGYKVFGKAEIIRTELVKKRIGEPHKLYTFIIGGSEEVQLSPCNFYATEEEVIERIKELLI